jgi:hypothetical protein
MAGRKASSRVVSPTTTGEPSKAELQRRMEDAREEISETVAEIKDTVTEQYESVKETVSETLDWREQFRKHAVAWSLGALAVGYVVGSGLAAAIKDTTPKKGRKNDGWLAEVYALGETLSDELSTVAQTFLLPALAKKIKDKFGIDISERLQAARAARHTARPGRKMTWKSSAKKSSSKKTATKRRTAGKRASQKRGAK